MLLLSEHLMTKRGKENNTAKCLLISMRMCVQILRTCVSSCVVWFMTVVPALDTKEQNIFLGFASQPD